MIHSLVSVLTFVLKIVIVVILVHHTVKLSEVVVLSALITLTAHFLNGEAVKQAELNAQQTLATLALCQDLILVVVLMEDV